MDLAVYLPQFSGSWPISVPCGLGTDARDGLEDLVDLLPHGVRGNAAVQFGFESVDLLVNPGEVAAEALPGAWIAGAGRTVFFHRTHLDELLASVQEIAEQSGFLGGQGLNGKRHRLRELREDAGINGVGLGELTP